MSFLVPSQRGETQQAQPSSLSNHMPLSSFHPYHNSTMPSVSLSSPFLPLLPLLPKVGHTRCYWSLLSSNLHFIYLDPVLANHLGQQANDLIGKSLIQFVHPEEQASAESDLGGVLESKTMHGSITRVRYCRLSRVRRLLGYQGPAAPFSEAEKIAVDAHYMAVDIVINWAADGLVLCFLHAVVDLTPSDNDERNKTKWTNWCGTPYMGQEQIQLLYQRLFHIFPQPGPMTRVFQILMNNQDRSLLFSWPPDSTDNYASGPTSKDFAKLVGGIQIGLGGTADNDATTSCTRRYKATLTMPSVAGEVESVFIPHGTVIFACHKVNSYGRNPSNPPAGMQSVYTTSSTYAPQPGYNYYDTPVNSYTLPPVSSPQSYGSYLPQSHHSTSPYSPQQWNQVTDAAAAAASQMPYDPWPSHSPAPTASPLPPSSSQMRTTTSYAPQPQSQSQAQSQSLSQSQSQSQQQQQAQWSHTSPFMETTGLPQSYQRPVSPDYGSYARSGNGNGEASASSSSVPDVVPPPRRRVSPGATRDHYGRSTGNRPVGVLKCSSCKATSSPEWRKGPSGKKELCNACGLRYARSRAKKEGYTATQRRRKDKALSMASSSKQESLPPPSPPAPASYAGHRRGGYDDTSFISTSSAGSGSGSDIYSHPNRAGLEDLTPSPSPPAGGSSAGGGGINFVHYSHSQQHQQSNSRNESRPHFMHTSGPFYSSASTAAALSHPGMHRQHGPRDGGGGGGVGGQMPGSRLGHLHSYGPSTASPISHSPLTSTIPLASYEREKDKGRELPPTPVSAEPRSERSKVLLHH